MTVEELINKLKQFDKDLPVAVYGGELAYDDEILHDYGIKVATSVSLRKTDDFDVKYVYIDF